MDICPCPSKLISERRPKGVSCPSPRPGPTSPCESLFSSRMDRRRFPIITFPSSNTGGASNVGGRENASTACSLRKGCACSPCSPVVSEGAAIGALLLAACVLTWIFSILLGESYICWRGIGRNVKSGLSGSEASGNTVSVTESRLPIDSRRIQVVNEPVNVQPSISGPDFLEISGVYSYRNRLHRGVNGHNEVNIYRLWVLWLKREAFAVRKLVLSRSQSQRSSGSSSLVCERW